MCSLAFSARPVKTPTDLYRLRTDFIQKSGIKIVTPWILWIPGRLRATDDISGVLFASWPFGACAAGASFAASVWSRPGEARPVPYLHFPSPHQRWASGMQCSGSSRPPGIVQACCTCSVPVPGGSPTAVESSPTIMPLASITPASACCSAPVACCCWSVEGT